MSLFFLGFDEEEEDEEGRESEEGHHPFPCLTETTGVTVHVTLHCIMRMDDVIERQNRERSLLLQSIDNVIKAFEEAKIRMTQVTKMIREEEEEGEVGETKKKGKKKKERKQELL